ncbi:hypothetical protein EDD15DRAFT_2520934 [Pisolithus albus]|nr:hypothetical protein EDD15DRAFT_2520934 [Pisolithus albus]
MELTILKAFCRGSNLKALLRQDNLPDAFRGIQGIFSQYLKSPLTGAVGEGLEAQAQAHLSDDNSDTPVISEKPNKLTELSTDQYQSLLECLNEGRHPASYISYEDDPRPFVCVIEPRVQDWQTVKLKGVSYACVSSHVGNSRVLFTVGGENFERAGEIRRIFTHRRAGPATKNVVVTEFFFVLRQFRELSVQQASYDPYRQFPLLSTRLCVDDFLDGEKVIRGHNIISHFAGCPYESPELRGGKFLVVLSLNRPLPKPKYLARGRGDKGGWATASPPLRLDLTRIKDLALRGMGHD